MAKQKIKRKELLKSPDEFLTFTERAINYIRDRSKYFEYAGIAVAAAAVIYLGVTTYLNYVDGQGQSAYNVAFSETAHDKADFEKSEGLFKKVKEEYRLSRVSTLVPAQVGYLNYRQKKYEEAVKHYEDYKQDLSDNSPYRILSLLALAAVHEQQGELDKAIGILSEVKSNPKNLFMDQTLLSLGRVYRLSKQEDKAKEVYREFVDRFETSPFLPLAKAKLDEQPS
jgi:outer membrane protein assembly factor BamD (BamD/ComL family)